MATSQPLPAEPAGRLGSADPAGQVGVQASSGEPEEGVLGGPPLLPYWIVCILPSDDQLRPGVPAFP